MDTTDRTILRRFILGIVVILLVGAIVWVFFFRDDAKKNTGNNTKTDSSQQAAQDDKATGAQQPAKAGSQVQGESTESSTSGQNHKQPDTLANTGPGNAALLFTSATALGALGHHLFARKRRLRAL